MLREQIPCFSGKVADTKSCRAGFFFSCLLACLLKHVASFSILLPVFLLCVTDLCIVCSLQLVREGICLDVCVFGTGGIQGVNLYRKSSVCLFMCAVSANLFCCGLSLLFVSVSYSGYRCAGVYVTCPSFLKPGFQTHVPVILQ